MTEETTLNALRLNVGFDTGTKYTPAQLNKMLHEKPLKEQTKTPIAQYFIKKMELAAKVSNVKLRGAALLRRPARTPG